MSAEPASGLVLIVNADDYGLCPEVNAGIERAHLEGVVTSTSVLVNQAAAAEVATLRSRCPRLGIGIHLTLTLGPPASSADRVRTLLDGDGRLLPLAALLGRARSGGLAPAEVVAECEAQVARLRELGVEPDHWDAHQHVQEYAPLTRLIAEAMSAAGLGRARNPSRVLLGASRLSPLQQLRARHRERSVRAITDRFATPDGLLETDLRRWERALRQLPDGVVEAICHPSEPSAALAALTPALDADRSRELGVLLRPSLRAAIGRRGARLAGFHALSPALRA